MAHKSCKSSADLGKFKIPRKTGPSEERHSSHKSDWQPPKFMKNVLEEIEYDQEWLNERYNQRGKFQPKTKYKKASSLPQSHFKSRTMIYKPGKDLDLSAILKDITNETAEIEEELTDWKQWKKQYDKNAYYGKNKNVNAKSKRTQSNNTFSQLKHELEAGKNKNVNTKSKRTHSNTFIQLKQELAGGKNKNVNAKSKRTQSNTFIRLKHELAAETELQRHQMLKADIKHKELQTKQNKSFRALKIICDDPNKHKNKHKNKNKNKNKNKKTRKKNKKKDIKLKEISCKKKKERERVANMELIAKQKTYELLDNFRRQQKEDKERKSLFKQISIGKLENERIKLELSNKKQTANKKWNGYYDNTRVFSPRTKRRKKKPKARKRDYRIFYTVNIQTYEKHKYIIQNELHLKYLFAQLFDLNSEKDVFDIQTRQKNKGFKIDFGIIIATSMHPSDYIDTFDEYLKDESFQDVIMEAFDLDQCPIVKIWEARYQKFVVTKQRKRRTFF